MLRATLKSGKPDSLAGGKVAMTEPPGRDKTGETKPEIVIRDEDLERRRRELEASLAARRVEEVVREGPDLAKPGWGQALKISSEFIAGVLVGAGLGWFFDRLAGTSPWGLIVFLLLGFGAGVLNVLRSAGLVAEAGVRTKSQDGSKK
jgi:ATP synthase protein I